MKYQPLVFSLCVSLSLPFVFSQAQAQPGFDGKPILTINQAGNLVIGRVGMAGSGPIYKGDLDVITLPECGGSPNQPIDAIRIIAPMNKAQGGDNPAAFIQSFAVIFNDGSTYEQRIDASMKNAWGPDGTPWFDLRGGKRCVRVVAVKGAKYPGSGQGPAAEVLVVGRR